MQAAYYKALCLYESGNGSKAIELFQEISDEGEFYAEKAAAFLKQPED